MLIRAFNTLLGLNVFHTEIDPPSFPQPHLARIDLSCVLLQQCNALAAPSDWNLPHHACIAENDEQTLLLAMTWRTCLLAADLTTQTNIKVESLLVSPPALISPFCETKYYF